MQPLPSSHPAGQLAFVSHEDGPLQLTEHEQASSQVTPDVHAFCPEQVTWHGVPAPHSTGPVQVLFALHSTVHAVALPHFTPPEHSPSAEQRTRQGTPAGQSTRSAQASPSLQSIAQVSPSQVPMPAHAVAQSRGVSPASGSAADASGPPPSPLAGDASIRVGPESRPPPPAPELSNPQPLATQASAIQALAAAEPMLLQGRRSPACGVG